jgi:hypothetical protein
MFVVVPAREILPSLDCYILQIPRPTVIYLFKIVEVTNDYIHTLHSFICISTGRNARVVGNITCCVPNTNCIFEDHVSNMRFNFI